MQIVAPPVLDRQLFRNNICPKLKESPNTKRRKSVSGTGASDAGKKDRRQELKELSKASVALDVGKVEGSKGICQSKR